jgi:hypothetical protein
LARAAGEPAAAARALARRQFARTHAESVPQSALHEEVERLMPELEASGDVLALAEAAFFLGVSFHWMGQEVRAIELLERARELGLRGGDLRIAAEAAGWYVAAVLSAPLPAVVAVERWRELSVSMPLSRYARALGESMTAVALAMTGDIDTARTWCARGREAVRELGDETGTHASSIMHGWIELLAGDFLAADRIVTAGERGLELLGEDGYRSSVLVYVADARQAMGRPDEAIDATERSEAITVEDDLETSAGWRLARARSLADLGRFEEAERWAREGAGMVAETDVAESTMAQGWSGLGYVLACGGRHREAHEAYQRALERHELKGTVLSIARLRRTMAVLRGEDPGPPRVSPGAWGTTWPLFSVPGARAP